MQYYGNYIAGFNVYSNGWKVLHYNPVVSMLYWIASNPKIQLTQA